LTAEKNKASSRKRSWGDGCKRGCEMRYGNKIGKRMGSLTSATIEQAERHKVSRVGKKLVAGTKASCHKHER